MQDAFCWLDPPPERRDIEHILFGTVDQVAALYMENGSDSPKQRKSNSAKQPVDDASNWQRAQDIAAEAKKSDAAISFH